MWVFDHEFACYCFVEHKNNVEKWHVEWTTCGNLKLWFDVWKDFLLQHGFACLPLEGESQEVVFFEDQDQHIINLDKTDLSLDWTDCKECSRKPTVCVAKDVPKGNEVKNKSNDGCTLALGSTAAGEALSPHMQFKLLAKAKNQCITPSRWKHIK